MKRIFTLAAILVLGIAAFAQTDYVSKVNPFVDSHRSRWFFFNSASLPFGMVSLNPDTGTAHSWGSGYLYDSLSVRCFSHIHNWQMSGVAVMPTTGEFKGHLGMDAYKSSFRHEGEIARPGYHKIHLDDYGITAELTSTCRVGYHRYTFPQCDDSYIVFDSGAFLAHGPTLYSEVWVVDSHTIAGWQISAATGRRPKDVPVFFFAELDRDFEGVVCWSEGKIVRNSHPERISGKDAGLAVRFKTVEGEQITMKVAISFTSVENARANLLAEASDKDFDLVASEAACQWNEMLGRIDVTGGTHEQQVKFYTDLWHSLLGRHIVSDADGQYMDMTGDFPVIRRIPCGPDGHPLYAHHNFDAWWGSHWSLDILWGLVYPEIVDEFCNTMVDYYHNGGLIPRGPSAGNYTFVMIGDTAAPFIVSAFNKGIRGFDTLSAYEGLRKNAFKGGIRDHAGYEHGKDAHSGGMEWYETKGYVPDGRDNVRGMHTTGAAMTLEYAYQDWCLSQMALNMGFEQDYRFFLERSGNYRNVWDPAVGYMHARDTNGYFLPDFDPLEISEKDGFCESNAAIYSHFVPHDMQGLIELFGGRKKYIERLDKQFRLSQPNGFFRSTDPSLKQYNWTDYGNQPGTGMAHLFSHAGAPWLTQKWVRLVKEAYGDITPYGGYRDDEDQGQMGALGVLLAMGLFEVDGGCAAEPYYEITSPIFDKITIRLNGKYYEGESFEIETRNNSDKNMYIQNASLNGQPWNKCTISHKDLVKGGTLVLQMGPKPAKKWGVAMSMKSY